MKGGLSVTKREWGRAIMRDLRKGVTVAAVLAAVASAYWWLTGGRSVARLSDAYFLTGFVTVVLGVVLLGRPAESTRSSNIWDRALTEQEALAEAKESASQSIRGSIGSHLRPTILLIGGGIPLVVGILLPRLFP